MPVQPSQSTCVLQLWLYKRTENTTPTLVRHHDLLLDSLRLVLLTACTSVFPRHGYSGEEGAWSSSTTLQPIVGRPRKSVRNSAAPLKDNKCRAKYSLKKHNMVPPGINQRTNARSQSLWWTSSRTVGKRRQHNYFARCLIFLLFLWRRRVLFFFHFQRILAVDFLYGHPWPMINKLYFSTEVPVLAFCEKYNM